MSLLIVPIFVPVWWIVLCVLCCVYWPACIVQLNIDCSQFGDLSFTFFPPAGRLIWAFHFLLITDICESSKNLIFFLICIFPSCFLENEQGLKNLGGDEKGTDRQLDRQCQHINLTSIGNQAIWNCGAWINENVKPWAHLNLSYSLIEIHRIYWSVYEM